MKTIHTKFLSATQNWPARIIAKDRDNNRIIFRLPPEHARDEDVHRQAANALCNRMGWGRGALIGGHVKDGMIWIFADALEELFNWAIAANNRLPFEQGDAEGRQFGGNSHANPIFKNAARVLGMEIP